MNAKDHAGSRRELPTAHRPEVRVVVTARHRLAGRLDHALTPQDDDRVASALGGSEALPDDPAIEAIVEAARPHVDAGAWMITGGEPTLRGDFPQLVKALSAAGAPDLGLITDGLALTNPKIPALLAQLGLSRVRVRLHGARADAHDWLAGMPGAWKRAGKAIRLCAAAGLHVEVECTVTRPTRPYLREAVDFFAKLGARYVILRRVTSRGPARAHDVAVMPRFGLMPAELEQAVQHGMRDGLTLGIEGFPRCVAPSVAGWTVPLDAVTWALPPSLRMLEPFFAPPTGERGCGSCPGAPSCCGAPSDYIRRFGRTEIDSETNRLGRPGKLPKTPLLDGDTYPPPRAGRYPPTRLSYVRAVVRLDSLADDPLVAVARRPAASTARFVFLAPSSISDPVLGDRPGPVEPETTRDARIRLVKVAQHGFHTLRIAGGGSLAHPQSAELLREATRLQFPSIEVAGEGSPLDGFSDMQIRRLRGITRLDVALFDADPAAHDAIVGREGAFEAALRALDRFGTLVPSIQLGCYAVLRSADQLEAFAEAWDFGDLPGDPWFRLAPEGGSLTALAEAAGSLPEGPARDAIAAVLPKRLFDRPDHVVPAAEATHAWGDVPDAYRNPSGSDRLGCYTERPSADSGPQPGGDPGLAVGWSAD